MAEWITDRLPTAADADEDGDVRVCFEQSGRSEDGIYVHYSEVVPGQPWWSPKAAAQPTPPPAPAPAPTRVVTAMTANDLRLYAACNDGTMWAVGAVSGEWHQIPSIPQPEAPNA